MASQKKTMFIAAIKIWTDKFTDNFVKLKIMSVFI